MKYNKCCYLTLNMFLELDLFYEWENFQLIGMQILLFFSSEMDMYFWDDYDEMRRAMQIWRMLNAREIYISLHILDDNYWWLMNFFKVAKAALSNF